MRDVAPKPHTAELASPAGRTVTPLLSTIFFLTGAAGLAFEMLWFRQAGLTFGNSVWASTVVLSGFMGGLALGNAATIRYGEMLRRPLFAYGVLEATIGIVGFGLVALFPALPGIFAPVFRPLLGEPQLLNPLRLALAFVLLLLPTTAMGASLPIMVRVFHARTPGFGRVLGWLYGLNTLGAMAGALLCEELFIPRFGLLGGAALAATMNLVAALVALWLARSDPEEEASPHLQPAPPEAARHQAGGPRLLPLLGAAGLAGAILLALEVVWFRFLQLFVVSTSRIFALMLVVVLAGIGLGSLSASLTLRLRPDAHRLAGHIALGAGLLTVLCYVRFDDLILDFQGAGADLSTALRLSLHLMLPVSWASGVLFTFLGRSAFDRFRIETRAVGWVTLANTLGAMLGAMAGGWILLPRLGIERSIFVLALLYGVVACLAPGGLFATSRSRPAALSLRLIGVGLLAALTLFPFGLMQHHFIPTVVRPWLDGSGRVVATREGLTETIIYLEEQLFDLPLSYKLITNSFSMSATNLTGQRYMKHFVYWPLAFHPRVEDALLISYGVGVTAKALTDSPEIAHIDVVDISRDILEMNRAVYPEPGTFPLDDPRVEVFIEDGRFFLLATDRSYDLITAEPPPLKLPGVVNLYTQEYFHLLRDRLKPGGIVTYWLPVDLLTATDTKSIVRAFCEVFENCSLWRGIQMQLVLVGSRGAAAPIDSERFGRLWRDPARREELRVLGFETPELLLTTFVADASYLRELARDTPPLVDNFPYRLSRRLETDSQFHYALLAPEAVVERYQTSRYLRRLVPPELLASALDYWPYQHLIDAALDPRLRPRKTPLAAIDSILTHTQLRTPAAWLMGDLYESSRVIERLEAEGSTEPQVLFLLGVRAMSRRQFPEAAELFRRVRSTPAMEADPRPYELGVLAYAYGGQLSSAQALLDEIASSAVSTAVNPALWSFSQRRFGLEGAAAGQLAPSSGRP